MLIILVKAVAFRCTAACYKQPLIYCVRRFIIKSVNLHVPRVSVLYLLWLIVSESVWNKNGILEI